MKNILYILIIVFIWSCSSTTKDIELTVRKDKVIFHNWYPKELNNKKSAIYILNKREGKLNETPIAGQFKYEIGNKLTFIPSFPLLENTNYVLIRTIDGKKEEQQFSLPKKKRMPLTVSKVYPSGNNLNGLFDHKVGSLKNDKEGETVTIPLQVNE